MKNWDEVRIAYHVAKIGTVSGAAQAMGVHHATVIRQIDSLEKRMGTKLFQRHARGYTPTDAGMELLRTAHVTADQFAQLANRIRGQGDSVAGELVITSLASFSQFLMPILVEFQQFHKDLSIRYLTDTRLFQLEYGEAHVAIRAGQKPDQPDNVVQKFMITQNALYGSQAYVDRMGIPSDENDLANHVFVSYDGPQENAPYIKWIKDNIAPDQVKFWVAQEHTMQQAIIAGAGLGFLSQRVADSLDGLVKVLPSRLEWQAQLWLVTHVDLHRTAKVQTFLKFLKTNVEKGT